MAEILNFCGHTLATSSRQVCSYEAFQMGQDVPTDTELVDEVEQVARRGIGKATLSLAVPLLAALGVEVLGEFAAWRALADSGARGRLYVAGRALDDLEWMLTHVGLVDPMAGPRGGIYRARLQLGFDGSLPLEEAERRAGAGTRTATPDPTDPANLDGAKRGLIRTRDGRVVPMQVPAGADPVGMWRDTMIAYRAATQAAKGGQGRGDSGTPE